MRRITTCLLSTFAVASAALVVAAPASADSVADSFLTALDQAGVTAPTAVDKVALGQSVCPMLSEPGQNAANVAARVADTAGMPLGPATMFTGVAISMFCPAAVAGIGDGKVFGLEPAGLLDISRGLAGV
ncbi:DUF732 domain-containing protein [Mycobacterium sp. AMU20-3851]|jgi:acetyl-CoA acetyltransferase|uniref:DUF732 domain-containing protein n=1 Tax=Mycobacterium sp. AMU20-3851 TaxID=3122055 RepID=UPI0037550916